MEFFKFSNHPFPDLPESLNCSLKKTQRVKCLFYTNYNVYLNPLPTTQELHCIWFTSSTSCFFVYEIAKILEKQRDDRALLVCVQYCKY